MFWAGVLALVLLTPSPVAAQSIAAPSISGAIPDSLFTRLGSTVTVRARVDNMLAHQGFTVESSGLADEILVVSAPTPGQPTNHWTGVWSRNWREGNLVEVLGRIEIFRLADYERQFGVDMDDRLFRGWEGRPVLFASSVLVVPES
jgi:hypothetical protein